MIGARHEPILSISDLRIDFELGGETVHAVRGIDVEVGHGEIVAIVGESGCGKSAARSRIAASEA